MSNRFIRSGDSIQHTPAAAVANGDVVVAGALVGVAQEDIAAAETGTVAIAGCWRLPKIAVAVTQGQMLHLNTDADADVNKAIVVADAGDLENFAVALAAAGAADDDVEALLLPGNATVKA